MHNVIKKSLPLTVVMMAVVGCAVNPRATIDWSKQAQAVAGQRLAAAGQEVGSPDANDRFVWKGSVQGELRRAVTAEVAGHYLASTSEGNGQAISTTQPATTQSAIKRGPLPGFYETLKRDVKEMPGLLWSDTKAVYTNPGNLLFLLGAGGVSAALRPEVDDDFEDHFDRHDMFTGDWNDTFGALGNPATHFAAAGVFYLLGQQMQHDKTYEVGKRMISALTITGVSTMTLKVAANTRAPNGENLGWPSGHVSSTMAMATVLNDAYGPFVGVPMFGLTALVGAERMDDGEHHFSDVVFGAALGWVVAETVMKEHQPEIFGGQVTPYFDPYSGNTGLAWVKTLGN